MSKSSKKKAVSKDDLRRLMKQHKSSGANKTVDSPLAKYNKLNQLICIVCNQHIKSSILWNPHLQGRSHKENYEVWKSQQNAPQQKASTFVHSAKRKMEEKGYAAALKKSKIEKGTEEENGASRKSVVGRLGLAHYSDSESEEEESQTEVRPPSPPPDAAPSSSSAAGGGLPTDFFDTPGDSAAKGSTSEATPGEPKVIADALPEGFFDNPVEDAKVRKVEYVDKKEAEWELFQKTIKAEDIVSEVIQEEDEEKGQVEKNIEQIDDQIARWSRVNDLQEKKEQWKDTAGEQGGQQGSGSDSDSDQDAEDLMDWRAKGAWKR